MFNLLKTSETLVRLMRSKAGNLALIGAIAMPAMLAAVGASIDTAYWMQLRGSVQGIADSAALSGVAKTAMDTTLSWEAQKSKSQAMAKAYYESAMKAQSLKVLGTGKVTYTLNQVNTLLTVKICYEYNYPTIFKGIYPFSTMKVAGCATAIQAEPRFANIYFLVDASGSMGIGATAADQNLMQAKIGCQFGCHTTSWQSVNDCSSGNKNTYKCAKYFGAKMRFDVVNDAIATLVTKSTTLEKVPNQFKFGIYKFSNYLTKVSDLTTDRTLTATNLQKMEPDAEGAGSNLRYALTKLSAELPISGNGRSANSPQIFVIIMTDGVEGNVYEYKQNGWGGWQTYGAWYKDPNFVEASPGFWAGAERSQAVVPSMCDSLKAKGITVGTLNTEYMVPATNNDSRFVRIKSQLVPNIQNSMRLCASLDEYAYIASSPADIEKASNLLFSSMLAGARLTE